MTYLIIVGALLAVGKYGAAKGEGHGLRTDRASN
jgi:hypothetical protein